MNKISDYMKKYIKSLIEDDGIYPTLVATMYGMTIEELEELIS